MVTPRIKFFGVVLNLLHCTQILNVSARGLMYGSNPDYTPNIISKDFENCSSFNASVIVDQYMCMHFTKNQKHLYNNLKKYSYSISVDNKYSTDHQVHHIESRSLAYDWFMLFSIVRVKYITLLTGEEHILHSKQRKPAILLYLSSKNSVNLFPMIIHQ